MAADFNKPVTTDAYTAVLQSLRDSINAVACMLDPTTTPASGAANIPNGAHRFNASTGLFEWYNGTVWQTLGTNYISTSGGTLASGAVLALTTTGGNNAIGVAGGNGDACSATVNNLKLYSWYGIGFGPSISGQPVAYGSYSHWFDTRTGNMGIAGQLNAGGLLRGTNIVSTWSASAVETHLELGNSGLNRGFLYASSDGVYLGFAACNDSGSWQDTPIYFGRANGSQLFLTRPVQFSGMASAAQTFYGGTSGTYSAFISRSNVGVGDLMFQTNSGLNRWAIFRNVAETGGDAGGALCINAYNDAGSYIDQPVQIFRAAGGSIVLARPVTIYGPSVALATKDNAGASSVEIGGTTTSYTFIDFHSQGTVYNDYDARLDCAGGVNGTSGKGNVALYANQFTIACATQVNANLTSSGTISAPLVTQTSDETLKTNIRPLKTDAKAIFALEHAAALFDWRATLLPDAGFIAQRVGLAEPRAVHQREDGKLTINVVPIVAHLAAHAADVERRLQQLERRAA